MTPAQRTAAPELVIWERVFVPDPRHITAEQARYLLAVRFPQADLDRINELAARARDGALSEDESREMKRYVHVGHLLSILKAKVRRRLKEATGSS